MNLLYAGPDIKEGAQNSLPALPPVTAGNWQAQDPAVWAREYPTLDLKIKESLDGRGRPSFSLGPLPEGHREEFATFAGHAVADAQFQGVFEIRAASDAEAAEILKQGGPDVTGMQHEVTALEIRHAFNKHGDAEVEHRMGQRALTAQDIPRLLETLDDPDSIKVTPSTKANRTKVNYSKKFPDGTVVVAERIFESSKRNKPRLSFRTAWVTSPAGVESNTAQVYTPGRQGEGATREGTSQATSFSLGPSEPSGTDSLQPRLSFSRARSAGKWFLDLAQDLRRFRRGAASNSTDFAQIVSDYRLDPAEAHVEDLGYPFSPEAVNTYRIDLQAGGHAYLHVGRGEVWVQTNDMRGDLVEEPLKGGDLIYQSAMTYAHNNGLRFVPDPNGVSLIARHRRLSQMLTSALRHQTTKHLWPFGIDPKSNRSFEEVPGWQQGDSQDAFERNVDLLALAERDYVQGAMVGQGLSLEDLKYDPVTDTVLQRSKYDGTHNEKTFSGWQRLSQGDFDALVARLDPGNSGVGATTLSRALVTKSALEGHDRGRDSSGDRQPAEVDGGGEVSQDPGIALFRLLGPKARPKKLFYSQQQGNNLKGFARGAHPVQRTGVTQAEVDEALERLRTLPEAVGLVDSLLIVGNRQELDGKGRPGEADYHADDWADIETAEGYHDPDTGGTVVLRDQVEVREGETPAVAVARVILHERVGHEGVKVALALDPDLQKRWDRGSALIPAAELEALGKRYPELADRPVDLAFEWLAHRIGDDFSSGKLEPGSVAAQLWQVIKDAVAKFMNRVTGGKALSDAAMDAYAREMAQKARDRVRNGDVARMRNAGSGIQAGNGVANGATHEGDEADVQSLDEANTDARLQFAKPRNPRVTPISTGTIQASLDDVTDPVLLEKLEKENQDKFDEVREAKGSLGSPDDVGARNHEQKAFVDRFYKKAAYDAFMKDLRGEVVFLAMPSSSGKNRIPVYLAKRLASDFGGTVLEGSDYFYRPDNQESKKNTTYLAKMAMPEFEVDDASWKDRVEGKKVILVDDIITTGDSLDTIAQKLNAEGVKVEKVISVVAHNSGRGIQSDTVESLMKQINSQLADHPVQKNPILNKGLGESDEQKKTLLNWIIGAHGKSRDALLKKAIADANSADGALAVLKSIRKRYFKLKDKE